MMRFIGFVVGAFFCLVTNAYAQSDQYFWPEWAPATGMSGGCILVPGCSGVGSVDGHCIPTCAYGSAGSFIVFGPWMPGAGTGTLTIKGIDLIPATTPTTGFNKCFTFQCAVETASTQFPSDHLNTTFGTASGTIVVSLIASQAHKLVSAAPNTAITCRNLGQAAACSGTACDQHRVVLKVNTIVGASCASNNEANTQIDISFIAASES